MKIIKYILGTLVSIIVIILIVAAFAPSEYAVEREVTINKSVTEVFDYVKYLKNQDDFSKWASMDPDMKKTFTGVDGTVGFISAWESDNKDVGKGEQEIMKITEGERIDFELRFFEPFEASDNAYMITETDGNSATIVKWGFDGKMDYPMNIMLLAMDMEEMLGDDLQQGLNKLKVILEK
jgi:uncharacterized protein YndB with AHSA1/START domain